MTYINAITKQNQVLVWERNATNKRTIQRYPAKHYCYLKDDSGLYTSIFGDNLTKKSFKNRAEMSEFLKTNKDKITRRVGGQETFESDIPTELRVLSEHYYNVKAPVLNVTFLDIEVDYDKTIGFSSVDNPYAPINAFALYHTHTNRMVIYAVPPNAETYKGDPKDLEQLQVTTKMNDIVPLPDDVENEIVLCGDEKELLHQFLWEIENSDIISGWNSDFFDVPYIGKRLMFMDGVTDDDLSEGVRSPLFSALSFEKAGRPKWRKIERYGNDAFMLDLEGRISLDYLDLFRKYEMAERPSYKLESISEEILPDLPKLEYEGSLADLYNSNFPLFCRYNFRDTEILKGFEEKLGYVELANQMVHLSTGLFKHVGGTLKLAELATVNFCHHELDQIVNDVHPDDSGDSIKGAFVLIPQVGMHEGIGSVDINSLYPSAIRSINISPETLIGQFANTIDDAKAIADGTDDKIILKFDNGDVMEATAKSWRDTLWQMKWAVSGYGTVFDQSKKGIIPAILENWYATRKQYQKQMIDAKNDGKKDEAAYFDRLQYVYKIKLNSFYGALTNAYFRFYDLRMGESTTGTGRAILLHQCAEAVNVISGEYVLPDRICIKHEKGPKKGEYEPATQTQISDPEVDIHYGYSEKYPIIYGDSVAGNSIIETANAAQIEIEQLFTSVDYVDGNKEYSNCCGVEALTFNQNTNQNEFQPVKYIVRHKVNKKMYRVWFGNTRYLDVTEDHSLIGYANSKSKTPGLIEVKPMDIGKNNVNSLILNRHIPKTTNPNIMNDLSTEMFQLIGFIIGDGHVERKKESGVGISIGSIDKQEIISKLIQPLIDQGWFTSITHMKNGHDIRLCGVKGWNFLRNHLYSSGTKQFPSWIFDISTDKMAAVLRGYFSADGFANKNHTIGLCSISLEFIKTAHRLLKFCGIPSNYWTERTENSFLDRFSGTYTKRLTVYNGPAFNSTIGFIQDRKNINVQMKYTRTTQHMIDQSGYTFIRPTKVEIIEHDDYVYDIEVGSSHMFYANDLLVHNTDSTYFDIDDNTPNKENVVIRADEVGELVNKSFPEYMARTFLCQPEYDQIIKTGREIVSDRGMFVDKKRYILHIINDDGFEVDKIKVMGLDTKKTTMPKPVANKINGFIERLLKGEDWDAIAPDVVTYKEMMNNVDANDFMTIGLPKGVKNIETYTKAYVKDPTCFLPGHVSAAIFYNKCIVDRKDTETIPIHSGDKIKVFYLLTANGRFKSIAIQGDVEQVPGWFLQEYVPLIDKQAHIKRLVDKPLGNIIKAIGLTPPSKQSLFVDDLLEF